MSNKLICYSGPGLTSNKLISNSRPGLASNKLPWLL